MPGRGRGCGRERDNRLGQRAHGAFFGYTAEEIEGKSIELLVPERFRHSHRAHRGAYSNQPRARNMGAGLDLWARRKDGSEFPVDISLAPIGGDGGQLVVAAVRDISERQAAQSARPSWLPSCSPRLTGFFPCPTGAS